MIDYVILTHRAGNARLTSTFALDEDGRELLELVDSDPAKADAWRDEATVCDPWRGANPDLQGAVIALLGKTPSDETFPDWEWTYNELIRKGWVTLRSDGTNVSIEGVSEDGTYLEAEGEAQADAADMAQGEAMEDLRDALDAFKRATADLDRVWSSGAHRGDEVANYPAGLPSFDEFAASVACMEVRT